MKKFLCLCATMSYIFLLSLGSFHMGYDSAIKDAELVQTSNDGYEISFNGEVHYYETA